MEKRIILAFIISMLLISIYNTMVLKPLEKEKKGMVPAQSVSVEGAMQEEASDVGLSVSENKDVVSSLLKAFSSEKLSNEEVPIRDGSYFVSKRGILGVRQEVKLATDSVSISFSPPVGYGCDCFDYQVKENALYFSARGAGPFWILGPQLAHPQDLPNRYKKYNEGIILLRSFNHKAKRIPLYKVKEKVFADDFAGVGLYSKYYLSFLEVSKGKIGEVRVIENEDKVLLAVKIVPVSKKEAVRLGFYAGLSRKEFVKGLSCDRKIVKRSLISGITDALWQVLKLCYLVSKNWGLAIILLSIVFSLIFLPLTIRSYSAMQKMQKMQPEMKSLQDKYKDDPTRLNQEIMALYAKYGVNPLSGCLPLLLQLPVFFALYPLLLNTYEFKGASFLWIKDLSKPDVLLNLGGFEVHLLPLLVGFLMFVQQRFSSTSNSAQNNSMLFVLPVVFTVIFYNMPSGLVLFWFVLSILNIAQQKYISKTLKG